MERGRRHGRPRVVREPVPSSGSSSESRPNQRDPDRRARRQAEIDARLIAAYERGRQAREGGQAEPVGAQDEGDRFKRIYDNFDRLRPPRFHGDGGYVVAEEWLASIKAKFHLSRAHEVDHVELAEQLLEGTARCWWENTKRSWTGNPLQITWQWFEEKFTAKFLGHMQKEALRKKFMSLQQGNMTVAEYNTMFTNLSRYAPDIAANPNLYKQHYCDGLNLDISALIEKPKPQDVVGLMDKVEVVEKNFKKKEEMIKAMRQERNVRQRVDKGPSKQFSKGSRSSSVPPANMPLKSQPWCARCHKPHDEANCHYKNKACFNCGATDHWVRDCPKPRREATSGGVVSNFRGRGGRSFRGGRSGGRTVVHAIETEIQPTGEVKE